MRHKVKGRKLGRKTAHRKALLQSLTKELFEHEKIITTLAKAKEVRPIAEKLITKAKVYSLHKFRLTLAFLRDKKITNKLFKEIGPLFKERNGGYIRIIRMGGTRWDTDQNSKWAMNRLGDNSPRAVIELVEHTESFKEQEELKTDKKTKGKKR